MSTTEFSSTSFRVARITSPSQETRHTPISGGLADRVIVVPAGIVTTRLRRRQKPTIGCTRRYLDPTDPCRAIGEPLHSPSKIGQYRVLEPHPSRRSFAEHAPFWHVRQPARNQTVRARIYAESVLFGTFSAPFSRKTPSESAPYPRLPRASLAGRERARCPKAWGNPPGAQERG